MQKIKPIIMLIVMVAFSSCRFNQSVRKDIITGAYSRGDGIGSDDVVIEINGKTENRNEIEKWILDFNWAERLNKFKKENPAKKEAQQLDTVNSMETEKLTRTTWKRNSEAGEYYYAFRKAKNEIRGLAQLIKDNKIVSERIVSVERLDKKERGSLLPYKNFLDVIKIDDEFYYWGKDTEGSQENTYYLVTDPDASSDYKLLTPLNEWFIYAAEEDHLRKLNWQELEMEVEQSLKSLDALANFDFVKMCDKAQKHLAEIPAKEEIIDAYHKLYQGGDAESFADFLTEDFSYQRQFMTFATKKYPWLELKKDIDFFNSIYPSARLMHTEQIEKKEQQYIYEVQYEVSKEALQSTLRTIAVFDFSKEGKLSAITLYEDGFDMTQIITPEYLPPNEDELLLVYDYYKALNNFDFTSVAAMLDDDIIHFALAGGFSVKHNKEQLLKTLGLRLEGSYSGYEIIGKYRNEIYVNVNTRVNSARLRIEIDTQDRFEIKQGKIVKMTTKLMGN